MKHIKLFEDFVNEALSSKKNYERVNENLKFNDSGKTMLPTYYGVNDKFKGSEWETDLRNPNIDVKIEKGNKIIVSWKTKEAAKIVRATILSMLKSVFKKTWPADLLKDWDKDFQK